MGHVRSRYRGSTCGIQSDAESSGSDHKRRVQAFIDATKDVPLTAVTRPMAADFLAKLQVTNRVVHGNQVTVEWVATGTHTGDLPDLPASGRSFSLRGVTVVIRHDGKVVREALYYDVADLRRQLS